jgi:hypothetical protein
MTITLLYSNYTWSINNMQIYIYQATSLNNFNCFSFTYLPLPTPLFSFGLRPLTKTTISVVKGLMRIQLPISICIFLLTLLLFGGGGGGSPLCHMTCQFMERECDTQPFNTSWLPHKQMLWHSKVCILYKQCTFLVLHDSHDKLFPYTALTQVFRMETQIFLEGKNWTANITHMNFRF